jgi:23S rRNA (pseudouridine1915-N3)-methyltransferase
MKISFLVLAPTDEDYLKVGIKKYLDKISNYYPIEYVELPSLKGIKNMSIEEQKSKEADYFLTKIKAGDYLILLDENGKKFSSVKFAAFMQSTFNRGMKNIVFLVGGPFGFGEKVYERANDKISLSEMTFSHQMIRLLFTEQLYRAATIIKGEKYHHQ